jgi:septum formation protein
MNSIPYCSSAARRFFVDQAESLAGGLAGREEVGGRLAHPPLLSFSGRDDVAICLVAHARTLSLRKNGRMPRLILASRSPRRREILGWLGLEFEVVDPDVEELSEGDDPEGLVLENARLKAVAGLEAVGEPEDAMVLGVDTDVFVDGRMLGQPEDRNAAEERLRALSGREHEVLSGVCLIGPRVAGIPGAPLRERSGVSRSVVTFRDLDEGAILAYLDSEEWRGRAGGYAIQGLGSMLIAKVEGDFSNVVGLPIPVLLGLDPALAKGT